MSLSKWIRVYRTVWMQYLGRLLGYTKSLFGKLISFSKTLKDFFMFMVWLSRIVIETSSSKAITCSPSVISRLRASSSAMLLSCQFFWYFCETAILQNSGAINSKKCSYLFKVLKSRCSSSGNWWRTWLMSEILKSILSSGPSYYFLIVEGLLIPTNDSFTLASE